MCQCVSVCVCDARWERKGERRAVYHEPDGVRHLSEDLGGIRGHRRHPATPQNGVEPGLIHWVDSHAHIIGQILPGERKNKCQCCLSLPSSFSFLVTALCFCTTTLQFHTILPLFLPPSARSMQQYLVYFGGDVSVGLKTRARTCWRLDFISYQSINKHDWEWVVVQLGWMRLQISYKNEISVFQEELYTWMCLHLFCFFRPCLFPCSRCWILLYIFVAGLAVVECQACNSPLLHLFHRQLLIRSLLKPSHSSPVRVGGPRHLAKTHDRTQCNMCFFFCW